ncbi:MAG: Lrp/AsnC family transcriptional regulator [Planctomycetota bacterium]
MTEIERRILQIIQKGLPRTASPFDDMAQEAQIKTDELLSVLKDWKQQGKLRRIGAVINHFKVGPACGAMVVWQVEPQKCEQIGRILAKFTQVSHVYERQTCENWPYNLYTMVHGTSRDSLTDTVDRMSRESGLSDFRIMFTERELKKTPPVYITEE